MSEKPRILAIRGGAIGDFVVTLPALRLLRETFAHCHIELLGYPHIASLALHCGPEPGTTYVDAIRSMEARPLAGFFARNGELDSGLADYFASFQQVVSWLFDPDGIFEANLRRAGVRNYISAYTKINDQAHATAQLARGLESLALFLDDPAPVLFPDEKHTALAAEWLDKNDAPIAFHPGSGSPTKNWPIERWAEFVNTLGASHGSLLAIVGEAENNTLPAPFLTSYSGPEIRVANGLPLPKLAAMLAKCAGYYGHDTGISHIAAAVRVPTTVLFGPTDPAIWAPQGGHVRIVRAPGDDLSELKASDVLA